MARFTVTTPVPNLNTESAGVRFHDGRAEVDSATDHGVRALSYFRQAGYGIEALSGVEVDDALRAATLEPDVEARELRNEIARLADAAELDALREERDRMREAAEKARAARERPDDETSPTVEGVPAPPESDRVGEWRAYAVANLGVSEAHAKTLNTAELRALYERRVTEVTASEGSQA